MQEKQVAVLNVKKQTKKGLKEDCENGAGTAGFTVQLCAEQAQPWARVEQLEDHGKSSSISRYHAGGKDKMPLVSL